MRPMSRTAPGAATAWGDDTHHAEPGSFGGIGALGLHRNGELLGETGRPSGVFEVPAEAGTYRLEQNTMKIGGKVWARSTSVNSVGEFTSKLDENVYSQGIPIPSPGTTFRRTASRPPPRPTAGTSASP
ncbi:hypothetical protein [Streptomyces sp. NPDC088752]|uniref:hypothetical protein n=1 Tax=Streptomyces sp. NPDC088752 TaxID=3154963 RepID=UPI003439993F